MPDDLAYVLEHLPELVVKEVHGSGGYGMLVGPTSTAGEIEEFRDKLKRAAGQTTSPSRRCALRPARRSRRAGVAPRHVDLRPFVLTGDRIRVAGRLDAGRAEERLAGRQFQPGRRHQGHLGAGGLTRIARAHRRIALLDVALCRAGREHGAARRGRLPHLADAQGESKAIATNGARRSRAAVASRAISAVRRGHRQQGDPASPVRREQSRRASAPASKPARNNGRAVRTALTRDLWESLNTTWNELAQVKPHQIDTVRLPGFLDWVRSARCCFAAPAARTILRERHLSFQPARHLHRARR